MMNNLKPSDVHVSSRQYEFDHGAKPRGQGSWAFVEARYASGDYLGHVKWFNGVYSDAKRQAMVWFAARGVADVVVCS